MVASNRTALFDDPLENPLENPLDDPLSDDVLARVADLRARGRSWESTAREVGFAVEDLRRAVRTDPHFPAALEAARREVEQEAEADGLQRLRALLASDDPTIVRDAAEIIMKYLGEKRRDETRLEVERTRAGVRVARQQARAARAQEDDAAEAVERSQGLERAYAEECAREQAVVFLWGGCHRIGDAPPDATDTPLRLFCDHTMRGRVVYWAVTDPPPVADPSAGPFLAPPGCRPPTCPPADALTRRPAGACGS